MRPHKFESKTVVYSTEEYPAVSRDDIGDLMGQEAGLPHPGTMRLCLHPGPSSLLHEMYIVHRAGSYLRPHRHKDKDESCVVVSGEMALFFFNDSGEIIKFMGCGSYDSGSIFHVRIPRLTWHCQLVLSSRVVFLEESTGPFVKDNMEYAAFSPEPGSLAIDGFVTALHDYMARS